MAKRTGVLPAGGKHGSYTPDTGDLIWLSFSPEAGREQAGRRPAMVLSPRSYNEPTGLCIVCPVTSYVKDYPFEVALS
jgi:mRNA interferase MazF